MRCALLILVVFLFPLAVAITGDSITGNAPSAPTNVSILVLPGPPVIYIKSPENKTYHSTNVLVNYSITNDLNSSWYNADNTTNVSLGNLTENSFSLNLPYGFHTIYFYANNSYGSVSKNVSFTLQEQITPPVENNDGGNGGGGGGSPSSGINIQPNKIEIILPQGESTSQDIELTNQEGQELRVSLSIQGLEKYLSVESDSLTIDPKSSKTLTLTFSTLAYTIPDIYIGKIILQYGSFQKAIPAILTVKQRNALFDLNLNFDKDSFLPGEEVPTSLEIFNINSNETISVAVHLTITDFEKRVVYEFPSENSLIKENQTIYKNLFLPKNLPSGDYLLVGKIQYQDKSAASYKAFSVRENSLSLGNFVDRLNRGYYNTYLIALFVLVSATVFYLIKSLHKK